MSQLWVLLLLWLFTTSSFNMYNKITFVLHCSSVLTLLLSTLKRERLVQQGWVWGPLDPRSTRHNKKSNKPLGEWCCGFRVPFQSPSSRQRGTVLCLWYLWCSWQDNVYFKQTGWWSFTCEWMQLCICHLDQDAEHFQSSTKFLCILSWWWWTVYTDGCTSGRWETNRNIFEQFCCY